MSTLFHGTVKCSVCGTESSQGMIGSTNAFGSPDLDLRPPEMERSTMCYWVQECPECGYVSSSLDKETKLNKEWLKSGNYKSCSGLNFKSYLASLFYKFYLINLETDNYEGAFYAALHAAWACDDESDNENARHCRILALAEIEKLLSEDDNENLKVMRSDLLRRSGQFDKLTEEYNAEDFTEKTLQQIISFQLEKAEQEDDSCYRVSDALKNYSNPIK